jgi:hypothetical protein
MARPQNMDEVKRQIEQVLVAHTSPVSSRKIVEITRQAAGNHRGEESPEGESAETKQELVLANGPGASSHEAAADRVSRACDTTAADIETAAEVLLKVAQGIAQESHELAELLRKHGKLIANRIEEFTAMTQRVALRMREARADVLGSADGAATSPPDKPVSGSACVSLDQSA